ALGEAWDDAVTVGKAYVCRAMRESYALGKRAPRILEHSSWPATRLDFPWISRTVRSVDVRPRFPGLGLEPIGFYPIVDRASWLARLLPRGVRTAQLRVKDLNGEALEREIKEAIALGRRYDCRLF